MQVIIIFYELFPIVQLGEGFRVYMVSGIDVALYVSLCEQLEGSGRCIAQLSQGQGFRV